MTRKEVLEKIRNITLQEAEVEKDPELQHYWVGVSTGIQIALHADLYKLVGEICES